MRVPCAAPAAGIVTLAALAIAVATAAPSAPAQAPAPSTTVSPPAPAAALHPDETHLRNLRQLTFGGENAEAYWSPDGHRLILQHSDQATPCDQEFIVDVEDRNAGNDKLRRVWPVSTSMTNSWSQGAPSSLCWKMSRRPSGLQ